MRRKLRNHSEVAHIFAQRSQDEGEASNMSFRNGALYSYGTAIMRFCEHNGKMFLLVNDTDYSVSTSKHKGYARNATSHISPKFHLGNLRRGDDLRHINVGDMLHAYAMDRAAHFIQKSAKARTNKPFYLGQAQSWMGEAQRASDFFGLGKPVNRDELDRLIAVKEQAAKEHAEYIRVMEKKREEAERRDLELVRKDLEKWVRGEDVRRSLNRLPVRLRSDMGVEIVTSHGARIPYEEGRRAFRFVMKMRERGWKANGETFQIGEYQLNAVNGDGIVAGCHRISWDAILELANKEGWKP